MLKILGFWSSIMLPIFLKDTVYFLWGEADYPIDFDTVDSSLIPPALKSFDTYAKEFGSLGGGEELPLDVHSSPKMNLMLFFVSDCNLLILPLSRRDPHCLVLPTNLDISARLNRWYFAQFKRCSINSLSELLFIMYEI